jgi:hypothetical protein
MCIPSGRPRRLARSTQAARINRLRACRPVPSSVPSPGERATLTILNDAETLQGFHRHNGEALKAAPDQGRLSNRHSIILAASVDAQTAAPALIHFSNL